MKQVIENYLTYMLRIYSIDLLFDELVKRVNPDEIIEIFKDIEKQWSIPIGKGNPFKNKEV